MDNFRSWLLSLSYRQKRGLQVSADLMLVWIALWMAFVVRLGIEVGVTPVFEHPWLFLCAPLLALPIFAWFDLYRAVTRFLGNDALVSIFKAVSLASLMLGVVIYWYSNHQTLVPRSIIFNYWWLMLLMVGGLRLAVRQYFLGDLVGSGLSMPFINRTNGLPKVAVYGAGAAGNQLVAALRMSRTMVPVAFIDDDPGISNRMISGLPVYKSNQIQQMIGFTGAEEVLLAIPSASRARRREILEYLESLAIHVRSIPGFMDLASGRVKVDDLQEVDIADLLGRDSVPAQNELLEHCVTGKRVMITGAGGSIGSELSRQILSLKPDLLLLFENSEFNLYSILSELERQQPLASPGTRLLPVLGTVRNQEQMHRLMSSWKIDTVYHAAAYKHVPMVEHNIAEGLQNNVMGTLCTAQAALCSQVANFVLVSTDKAVRPTNVMGSSKRLAEMILQALSKEVAPVLFQDAGNVARVNKTRFTMVRFGNVLGSSGSVIPLFHKQIKAGGPLTVTHPNITRYFMTIPEAAQLVIQAGSMGQGGDVFVLDMGAPVRIAELAEKMIHLSGLSVRSPDNPEGDIAIEFTGLRHGEKLYEELLIGDDVTITRHPMILTTNEDHIAWESLKSLLADLLQALRDDDYDRVRDILRSTVSGYAPEGQIVDWIYLRQHPES